jgi:arylsulfatase A-like enzyme
MEATEDYLNRFPNLHVGRRTYAAMVSAMDDAIGNVIAALNNAGVREETLIFFLSDNGGPSGGISTTPNFSSNLPLRGYKATFFEGGIRVPFFVSWPARISAGRVISEPISSLDILPTALSATEVMTLPKTPLDGFDLLSILDGKAVATHDRLLFWRYFDNYTVRQGDWKMLQIAGQPRQLFNVRDDSAEATNLASSESSTMKQMAESVAMWDTGLLAPKWTRRFLAPSGEELLNPLPLAAEHAGADERQRLSSPPHTVGVERSAN